MRCKHDNCFTCPYEDCEWGSDYLTIEPRATDVVPFDDGEFRLNINGTADVMVARLQTSFSE